MAILSGFSLADCHFLFLYPEMDFDFSDYSRMGKTVPFQHILPPSVLLPLFLCRPSSQGADDWNVKINLYCCLLLITPSPSNMRGKKYKKTSHSLHLSLMSYPNSDWPYHPFLLGPLLWQESEGMARGFHTAFKKGWELTGFKYQSLRTKYKD